MSIYSKQINSINYSDIALLFSDGAKENIRLEFKREYPSKEEPLKKISSLANTWGGYIVIGIEQDINGKASALVGVEPKQGFQQQIIEWCYGSLYPPISPMISAPIQKIDDSSKVFYVVYVSESYDAPYFLNDRKGCYIGTDEFSQLFEPRLATYDEIMHLSNRRESAVELRESIISRANQRFLTHVEQGYAAYRNTIGDIDTTAWFAVIPSFPTQMPIDLSKLDKAINQIHIKARDVNFPDGAPNSQFDGFFFPDPRLLNFAYLEIDNHGLIYYSEEVGHMSEDAQAKNKDSSYRPFPSDIYIYSSWIIAWVIFYLKYAYHIYDILDYDGPLTLRVGLDRIQGRNFRIHRNRNGSEFDNVIPLLDKSISIERNINASTLQGDIIFITKDLFKAITFACG
jgi:hypothetical protein